MLGFILRLMPATVFAAALACGAHAQDKQAPTGAKSQGRDNALAMCIGCHGIPGYKTAFPSVYHVPKIAGQQPGYIINALKAYKAGERSHPSMRGIAAGLSEEDMKQLADYYGGGK
ncbi:MAG TPA: cytochrome c [Burkholderiales bacterium]|nr:cytochrome c [Burkholderiales bacterium]